MTNRSQCVSVALKVTCVFSFLVVLLGLIACNGAESGNRSPEVAESPMIEVFKSPSCQCCGKWVDHLEASGFSTKVTSTTDLNSIKEQYAIMPRYQSCHTGVAHGYVFEGHIPAAVIQQFLKEKPNNVIGLSVPGMPVGSPGMEVGERHDDYDVLLLKKDGSTEVYKHITRSS
jgi:hypothetical protein